MTRYRITEKIALLICFCGAAIFGLPAYAAAMEETPIVAEARELIDTYYGNDNLQKASALLERAYRSNPSDPHLLMQAARAAVLGGHIGFGELRPNTLELYGALLDRAIALDDSNARAHILKAQFFRAQKQYSAQLAELDKAKALGSTDPWLLVGYGDYYVGVEEATKAFEAYAEVQRRGPGSTTAQRKAYVRVLLSLTQFSRPDQAPGASLREYAALALKARHPADAWTPHGFAERFIDEQLFDDAIFYSREALKTMNFGAGRLTLATSLYGKAAQLNLAGKPRAESKPLIDEARNFKFTKGDIFTYVAQRVPDDKVPALVSSMNSIIPD